MVGAGRVRTGIGGRPGYRIGFAQAAVAFAYVLVIAHVLVIAVAVT